MILSLSFDGVGSGQRDVKYIFLPNPAFPIKRLTEQESQRYIYITETI
jgi:hypothetical protein